MRSLFDRHRGFTLIELLVVIAIIGILAGLVVPAVQQVREAARKTSCQNNLRQLSLALQNYESVAARYPVAGVYDMTDPHDSYSVHARLLPFLEQGNLYAQVDLNAEPATQPDVISQRIPTYLCPSEIQDVARVNGSKTTYPQNYGVNFGTWFLFDPANGNGGDGALSINRQTRTADIRDGSSNTIVFSEVKAYQPYVRNTAAPTVLKAPCPADAAEVLALAMSGSFRGPIGHTEWTDSPAHQSGVTFVLPPNTPVRYNSGGELFDIDVLTQVEGSDPTKPSYGAITSRSYHSGNLVNAAFLDGSVRPVTGMISSEIWRALGTRAGGEVITEEF
jgi:prepilin-type N-terminal cleavage/methylation domain-containing protein/prepilin-type processing-associated H-X9-DG protein